MKYFCTYFDINYLSRGLCLINSMEKYCNAFNIYILCLDEETFTIIRDLKKNYIIPINLNKLEAAEPDLIKIKITRSQIEYYYTCGPFFIYMLMEEYPEIDILTYLDADLYFFSSPEPLFSSFNGYSIGAMGHVLPKYRKTINQGTYNVGWVTFRNDKNGMECLKWWRDKCLEWCYERFEDGKYADQLYLDQWPVKFAGFYEFINPGANLAAWNVKYYHFKYNNNHVYVDDFPLIFYHFHGFKKISNNWYNTNLGLTFRFPNSILRKYVFKEYINNLEKYSIKNNPTTTIREYRAKYHYLKLIIRYVSGIIFFQYVYYKQR